MYKKLLIESGGGIISRSQQSPQAEAATIAIGLGGTGISCLRQLKKEVYNKLKPDDENAAIPEYKHIKFLAVDTDKSSLGDNGNVDTLDANTEFFNISCADINSLLSNTTHLANQSHLKWLKTSSDGTTQGGLSILEASAGAGGVRQIGRLLLLQSSNSFRSKIMNMVNVAKADLPADAGVNVMIFTGLGGGTGSGTFLDACYIVQDALNQIGCLGSSHICGFFFLPDINIAHVANEKTQKYVRVNGFAAMKELDYCMNFDTNGGEWSQQYEGFAVKSSAPPVKLAHLVTATDANGAIKSNAYGYAMHAVTDYVMEFLTKPYIPENAQESDGIFTIGSHIANIKRHIEMVDKGYGACYDYCVVGASSYYVPYKEVSTYLTSKIFEAFGNINEHVPSENNLIDFVKQYGFTYEDIRKNLKNGVSDIPNYAVETDILFDECQGVSDSSTIPHVLGKMRDSLPIIRGKYTENKKSMLENVEKAVVEDARNIDSLINKVKTALAQIASDYQRGPYYAKEMLHSVNVKALDNIIDGYIRTNDENLKNARGDLTLRDDAIEQTLRAFKNSKSGLFGKRKNAGEAYTAAVRNYFVKLADIEMYTELGDLLLKFKKQITDLYEQTFKIFTDVLTRLQQTFEKNLTDLSNNTNSQDVFEKKLMTIEELKDSLDESVKAMKLKDIVENFIETMLTTPDVWISQDENKIAKAVTDHFLSELDAFTSMTIINYLQIKFDTTDPNILKNKIYSEILMEAYNGATPMFWRDAGVYDITTASKIGYCSVPEISSEIKSAAGDLKNMDNNVDPRVLESSDRISVLQFLCGVPMFGYKGTDNYYLGYSSDGASMNGKHLYEGGRDQRDNSALPNIKPASLVSSDSNFATNEFKAYSEAYDKASSNGVLRADEIGTEKHYKIVIFDEEAIDEMEKSTLDAITKKNKIALDAVYEKMQTVPEKSSRFVRKTSAVEAEQEKYKRIVKDIVMSSPVLLELLEKQLSIYEKFNNMKAKVEEARFGADNFKVDIANFAKAVCSGAISVGDNAYSYVYEKSNFILTEKVELTNITTKPYGEDLPFYSAFVGYTNLSAEEKNAISEKVIQNKLNSPEVVAAKKTEILEYLKANITSMMNIAVGRFAESAVEIKEFLEKISVEVTL